VKHTRTYVTAMSTVGVAQLELPEWISQHLVRCQQCALRCQLVMRSSRRVSHAPTPDQPPTHLSLSSAQALIAYLSPQGITHLSLMMLDSSFPRRSTSAPAASRGVASTLPCSERMTSAVDRGHDDMAMMISLHMLWLTASRSSSCLI
jgi:hypothetical protein